MIHRKQLLSALGTFASKTLGSDPWMNGLMEGSLKLQEQVEQDLQELTLSAFRKHIPPFHKELVYALELDPAKRNATVEAVPKYDGETLYFLDEPDDPERRTNWLGMCHRFGEPSPSGAVYALPLTNVVSIAKIVDNPINPTVTLLPEKDFFLTGDAVQFTEDPCKDGAAKTYFLVDVLQDHKWIFKHFGCILGLDSKSSESYRSIVDGVFNAYIDGASAANIRSILREVTGNLNGENIKFLPLNRLAQPEDVKAVLLPKRFLGPDYFYGVVFVNEDLPLQEVGGQLRFYVGGNGNDVTRFWRDFEEHCVRHGTTVNEVLTLCSVKSRTAINPYRFFAEHIGRYAYTLVSIDYTDYPTDLTLDSVPLRHLTPPWNAMLIQQNITLEMEASIPGPSDDEIDYDDVSFMSLNFKLQP
jgi:hypothetical protein